ncbi:MAG: hypothetical protein IT560_14305 [Alphaproteobacteria bacterium]|nr:hypothetical protein [Alphaproteobacteria bacterium]
MNVPYWVEVCGYLVAAAAGGGVAWKVVKWLWATIRWINRLADDAQAFAAVLPVIINIAHQFERNNGASLRDAIDRIEKIANEAADKAKATADEMAQLRKETEVQTDILHSLKCQTCDPLKINKGQET